MYVALLADIHANLPAFEAVLTDMAKYSPKAVVIAGDLLGYYCDANDVMQKVRTLELPLYATCGNHDLPIIEGNIPNDALYGQILLSSLNHLSKNNLSFLKTLKTEITFEIHGLRFCVYHGTPDDPLNGRLYPDTEPNPNWFSNKIDFIILGHTHYPLIRRNQNSTIIVNPGSVGQPRDGNPAPSWALLNTQTMKVSFKRVDYDRLEYSQKLYNLNWDERAIRALFKNKKGPLNE